MNATAPERVVTALIDVLIDAGLLSRVTVLGEELLACRVCLKIDGHEPDCSVEDRLRKAARR